MLRLACTHTQVNNLYGLTMVIFNKGVDSLSILLSYTLIIKALLAITSQDARTKAFKTCISHICAILISLSILHRFGKHLSPIMHVLMADAYLLVPPVLNPILYTLKIKQIRWWIFRLFHPKTSCLHG
ncbi:hypothetical protein Y1Q_0012800 [Alligator mississippiensis]|uniref:G-protein coupled receptors family 1 profile domain-containing protein n=1 Tax=Alligator mississippiensis TaxID=8496 RepID=A0A151M1G6_ALLMI|nr:hypothetical protein Y1Q_0012800 [Alligator mississippiensis]